MTHESRQTLSLAVLLTVLVVFANARSWDIAVVIGQEINFFSQNQTMTGHTTIANAVSLTGLTYDDKTRTMYLSDSRNNVSIFSYDLTQQNFTSKPLLNRENGTHIMAIVFDTTSRTLFWSDGLKKLIMKMHVPLNEPPKGPVLLHNLKETPRGIALDACNSYIYWANTDKANPRIERSRYDGSDRETIIEKNLYEPLGVAIDHREGKLYWSDDEEGIHFKIERSNLDGSERELLIHNIHQEPVYLAVDNEAVYWSDWVQNTIWTISKNASNVSLPSKFKSYRSTNKDADIASIVTRDNVGGSIDCARARARTSARRAKDQSKKFVEPLAVSYSNLTTSTETEEANGNSSSEARGGDIDSDNLVAGAIGDVDLPNSCMNGGRFDKATDICRCRPGYIGAFCEIPLCHNYCLYGRCFVNDHGMPTCDCPSTHTGQRCERDVCDGYCLHEGQCSVQNGKPSCKCKYSWGLRCESINDMTKICSMICANDRLDSLTTINVTSCRCNETSSASQSSITFADGFGCETILYVLTALIIVLVVLIIILSYYVKKWRKRPRIKKRFVVSKGGITPLTSRPQIPDNQCEITIENCCNMNICETPCFEPKLRTPIPRNSNSKKEEKNSLLDNMEGNSC